MVFIEFSKAFDTVGPGYDSYWGSMAAQRRSQLWHYIPEWWRMLVLEGKSRNRSVSHMGSGKVVYWPPRASPSSNQQCSTRLSKTWGMASTYSLDRALTYSTSHTSERRPSLLDERAAIRRRQCTGCTLCWRDAENSGCFVRCVKGVRPEDYHQEDRGAVPTQLYKNPRGGYHGWWKQAELCSGIHLPRKHYTK